ncbi:MAG: EF-P beta-lysylation protein EpmB [Pseudomonadales bacterium]|nr:EF-P beta-lysylation protein EpmB [Pseudomonadales bacterium]
MITRTESRWQTEDWQKAMKNMIRDVRSLYQAVNLNPEDLPAELSSRLDFPVRVPQNFVQRMQKGNALDPLLLQVLPQTAEMQDIAGFSTDPLAEAEFNMAPGLIHKYHGRVLLISNPSCSVHCRYCFRRHFPYQENTPGSQHWHKAMDYIANNKEIHEVILSGGDPLAANDDYLQQLIDKIAQIKHVKTLRIHTRQPVVMPERITNELLAVLTSSRLKTVMVIHSNHAQELQGDTVEALQLLQAHGIRLLNQSVFLKGINDTVQAQKSLLESLYTLNIQAYYLHVLDKVQGAGHFFCKDEDTKEIYAKLVTLLPGYMLPRLVREYPHAASKTAIDIIKAV